MTFAYQYLYSIAAKHCFVGLFVIQASSPLRNWNTFSQVHAAEISIYANWINVPVYFYFFPLHFNVFGHSE